MSQENRLGDYQVLKTDAAFTNVPANDFIPVVSWTGLSLKI